MSSVQLVMMYCINSAVYSAQVLYTDKDCIGVTQLVVAISSVMPLGVGHVSFGCSPSGPGISPSSTGSSTPSGSIGAPSSSSSSDDAERLLLLEQQQNKTFCRVRCADEQLAGVRT